MPPSNSARQTKRYLIKSQEPERLSDFRSIVNADPTMELLDEVGPTGEPHTLVVGMGDEQAATLKQRFAGQVIIEQERSAPLNQPRGGPKGGKAGQAEEGSGRHTPVKTTEQPREKDSEMPDKPEQTQSSSPAMSAQAASGRSGPTPQGSSTRTAGATPRTNQLTRWSSTSARTTT